MYDDVHKEYCESCRSFINKVAAELTYPSLGWEVISFIEQYLCHGPGDIQGEDFILDNEYKWFVLQAYELYPMDHPLAGRRVYRRAVLSRAKGRAKSELAGALAVAEAVGPVLFCEWDENGWPTGQPVQAPVVRCFATEEGQAGNTFDNALYMVEYGKVWGSEWAPNGFDTGAKAINIPTGGSIISTTSAATSKDGGKDTFDVFDETHLWILPRLKKLHDTVARNLLKRKEAAGWALETTTMYCPGEESVAEQTFTAVDKAKGKLEDTLLDHRQAPDDINIKDDDDLRAGLVHAYGAASAWSNIDGYLSAFHDPTNAEADNRRYFLNQPWSTAEKFILPSQWDSINEPGCKIPKHAQVVIGLDGSFNNDCTGLVMASVEDVPIVEVLGVWARPDDLPDAVDWRVPRRDVMNTIREATKYYRVLEVTADPAHWQMELETLVDENIPITEFSQSGRKMIPATKRTYDCIVNDPAGKDEEGQPNHKIRTNSEAPNAEVLRKHMLNATVKRDSYGVRVIKDPLHPMNKIDLCVCAIMAVERAMSTIDLTPGVYDLDEIYAKHVAAERASKGLPPIDEEDEVDMSAPGAVKFIPVKYN